MGALEVWATDIAESLSTDKSNDWSEELTRLEEILNPAEASQDEDDKFLDRLVRISGEITLAENFAVNVYRDKEVEDGRFYFQISYWRKDVITGRMGFGFGGKAYLSPHASDSELVQTIFGLYKGFWEHEARETFQWRGRRVFGPHISTEALWEAAPKVDVRSAKHVEDTPESESDLDKRIQHHKLFYPGTSMDV